MNLYCLSFSPLLLCLCEGTDRNIYLSAPETAAPRPPTHTSIPALLTLLQNEYDALVLAIYNLEQKYNATRQELSYSLYAQDAASRVIARLIRERDAAREYARHVSFLIQNLLIYFPELLQMSRRRWVSHPQLVH